MQNGNTISFPHVETIDFSFTPRNIYSMKALARYRKKNRLSQHEMAALLGISQSMVAHLESGFRSPGWLLTQKIEAVTGISREKLRPDIFGEYKAA